jgi:hypothetical protein
MPCGGLHIVPGDAITIDRGRVVFPIQLDVPANVGVIEQGILQAVALAYGGELEKDDNRVGGIPRRTPLHAVASASFH